LVSSPTSAIAIIVATAAASVSRPTRVNRWGAVRVTREGYPVPDG
jgi:hypothetical protein